MPLEGHLPLTGPAPKMLHWCFNYAIMVITRPPERFQFFFRNLFSPSPSSKASSNSPHTVKAVQPLADVLRRHGQTPPVDQFSY